MYFYSKAKLNLYIKLKQHMNTEFKPIDFKWFRNILSVYGKLKNVIII